jgi:hypothetical protein
MSHLTILHDTGRSVTVRCICGTEFKSPRYRVVSGHVKSCGCKKHGQYVKHGQFQGGGSTHIMRVWRSMIQRCKTKTNSRFKYYGGRGITVCKEWLDFNRFMADMGDCPGDDYSIERNDVNKGYCKDNCKWIPKSEQPRNTRACVWIEYAGRRMIQQDWVRALNVGAAAFSEYRKKHGPEKAIEHYDKSGQFIHLNVSIINGRSLLRKGVL